MSSAVDFAILASVPQSTLEAGESIASETGYLALRTDDATQFFKRVDESRGDEPAIVLIYASQKRQMEGDSLKVTWLADYVGSVAAEGAGHPEGDEHLPPPDESAEGDEEEAEEEINPVYWHVANLRRLPENEEISIASLESNLQPGIYRRNTEPRRPALVAIPRALEEKSASE